MATVLQKEAGGEIIGGLARVFSGPFIGKNRSYALQGRIIKGISNTINDPLERGLHRIGAKKALSKIIEIGSTPISKKRLIIKTPKFMKKVPLIGKKENLFESAPYMPLKEQRRAAANWAADDAVHNMAQHPELIPMQSPVIPGYGLSPPGLTGMYMGAKNLGQRLLGVHDLGGKPKVPWLKKWLFNNKKPLPQVQAPSRPLPQFEPGLAMAKAASLNGFCDELVKLARVEPYQQKTQWTCSAACLKAVLAHYGIKIPELVAIDLVRAKKNKGAETDQITRAAHKLGLDAFEYSFRSLEQAKLLLDDDIPIICDIQSFKHRGSGHYVVLTKIDENSVEIMDPNTKGNWRKLSLEEFDSRWWDRAMKPPHKKMLRWGTIILPPIK